MPRKPENRTTMISRVDLATPAKIQQIAKTLGYIYGGEGSQGKLMDAIAQGKLILIQSQKQG